MAKIIDPDLLNQGTEVQFITGSKLIKLNPTGNLTPKDGVSMQALYSFTKEQWRSDNNLIKFPFPFISITAEQFELINGWNISGSLNDPSSSKAMIRDAGWALKDSAGNSNEEYMSVTSLGSYNSTTDTAYYLQSSSGTPQNTIYSAEINEPVLIYASGSDLYSARNYRDFFKLFLRIQGKTYGSYDLLTEQNISSLTYKKYAMPLSNGVDSKIGTADNIITGSAPYSGMSITYYSSSQNRTIGAASYPFKIIVNGNNGTAEQIYEFVQWSLRRSADIDSGTNYSPIFGNISEELLQFVGDTLKTKVTTYGGVYIDNYQLTDINRLQFVDNSGSIRTFPYVAAGTILFNDNLRNDASSKYFIFFSNDDSGDNTGRDFGTNDAIIMKDNTQLPITGSVNGSGSKGFSYDYDNNIQRGNASSGSDAPYTAVALGLGTAQYVVTTGTIVRSNSNSINFVAPLERNYLNP